MKKSFILHIDSLDVLDELDDEQTAVLFRMIKWYVNGEEIGDCNPIAKVAFVPFKNQLDRDQKKYDAICERNAKNGAKGGRPKQEPKKPTGLSGNPKNPSEPQKAHNDSESDSKNKKEYIHFEDFWNIYPRKTNKKGAKDKWSSLKIEDSTFQEIKKSLDKLRVSDQWKKGIIPHATTYLNQRRWEDDEDEVSNEEGIILPAILE
jgi:hypothetical protein